MVLIINTANEEYLEVILAASRDDFKSKKVSGRQRQAEELLPAVGELLAAAEQKPPSIDGLAAVNGGTGFTALRIGVVTANILAYAWSKPVVGIRPEEFSDNEELVTAALNKINATKAGGIVLPEYGREPNIS